MSKIIMKQLVYDMLK